MKIIKKREWEKINQTMVDLQMDLNDQMEQNKILEEQVKYLQNRVELEIENNKKISKKLDEYEVKIKSKTNDLRKLKTYLTQNNIDYDVILGKKEK